MKLTQRWVLALFLPLFSFCIFVEELLHAIEDRETKAIDQTQSLNQAPNSLKNKNLKGTQTVLKFGPSNSVVYSQPITFVANVVPVILPGATPTGNVQFKINQDIVATQSLLGGTATFTTTSIPANPREPYYITATYTGNDMYQQSGDTLGLVVLQANTSMQLISSYNPSSMGQSISFTAIVSAKSPAVEIPDGVVEFKINGKSLANINLDPSGQAIFSTSDLPAGTHTIVATYKGNTNFDTTWANGIQQVGKAMTYTSLSSSPNPSEFGKEVKSIATVTAENIIPSGLVQFKVDGLNIGAPQSLDSKGQASLNIPELTVGIHRIDATYAGNLNFNSSINSVAQKVNRATPNITVSSSANPTAFGEEVNIAVKVFTDSSELSGKVQFKLDGKNIGSSQSLDSHGQVFLSLSDLTVGTHHIDANYLGNESFNPVSATLTQQVNKANTSATLEGSAISSILGEPLTFTIVVSAVKGIPTGTVQFLIDGKNSGNPINLDNKGQASITIDNAEVGSHKVTATYSGNANFNQSTSSELNFSVKAPVEEPKPEDIPGEAEDIKGDDSKEAEPVPEVKDKLEQIEKVTPKEESKKEQKRDVKKLDHEKKPLPKEKAASKENSEEILS